MQLDFDLVHAETADAIGELDLLAIDLDAALGQRLDDFLGADGTEEFGLVRHAGGDLDRGTLHALGEREGLHFTLGLRLGGLLAEDLDLTLGSGRGGDRECMGEEIVAGVPGLHLDDVAHVAQLEHVFDEENFLFSHGSPHSPT